MTLPPLEVLGIGNPFIDHIIDVDDSYLQLIEGKKGGMVAVDYKTLMTIVEETQKEPLLVFGGSGANTLRGLAHLGHHCGLVGRMGSDLAGAKYLKKMNEIGLRSFLVLSTTPTAQAVCLITPDMERTMRSFLGASVEMSPDDVDPSLLHGIRLLHIEGYSLLYPRLTEHCMELAKNRNVTVSFDLGSFEVVSSHRKRILALLEQYVDIVFANAEEVYALTGQNPEKGIEILKKLCSIVIVLLGKEGCLVSNQEKKIAFSALSVKAIDTTGAGDLFASGFLHGYLTNASLENCARFGILTGGAVVQVRGVELPLEHWTQIKQKMEEESFNL